VTVEVDDLPRRNGELAFDAPWQSRVFGLAAAVVTTRCAGDWSAFRQHLVAAVAAQPGRPYWESWTAALEALVTGNGDLSTEGIDRHCSQQTAHSTGTTPTGTLDRGRSP
jgi:hypothetical protein